MSVRKRRSINWNALYGWLILIVWSSAFLWGSILDVGTVDCNGATTTWWLVIGVIALFSTLFFAGFLVGHSQTPSKESNGFVLKAESIYNRLNRRSQNVIHSFLNELYNPENKIIK